MIPAVEALVREHDMLPEGALVLAAVSGGLDSMCLVHYLLARGTRVAAAHLNHGLRGAAADEDEAFVRAWCAARGVPCVTERADVAALARVRGESVEEAGRRARYDFLTRTADALGAARIATAHHANDNAETLLFRLARGTGLRGLGGIAPRRNRVVRPFLALPREALEAYAKENGVPFREDASNADPAYARNLLRAAALPQLARVNPAAAAHMSETALRLRRDEEYLDALAAARMTALARGDGEVSLPLAALTAAPAPLRQRMLRRMLAVLETGEKDDTARHYAALEALAAGEGEAQLSLPHGVTARRADGLLTLRASGTAPAAPCALKVGQTLVWNGGTMTLRRAARDAVRPDDVLLRADTPPLRVGPWSPRARIKLAGAPERSLKRLFAERGIPPETRDRAPVLWCGAEAAAVYGVGTAEAYAPPEDAMEVLVWDVHS